MNEISRELLKIARCLTGGLFEPPPVMVRDITKWALKEKKRFKAEDAFDVWQDRLKKSLEDIEIEKTKIKNFENKIKSGESKWQRRLDIARDNLEDELDHYQNLKRNKPKRVGKSRYSVTEYFPIDLKGWKYTDVGDFSFYDGRRSIKVTLYNEYSKEKSGNFDMRTWHMGVWTLGRSDGEVKRTVKHELTHFAQSLLEDIVGTPVGRPSKKIQTPTIKQKPGEINHLHSLDDIEFYTKLQGSIDYFLEIHRGQSSQSDIKRFVGLTGNNADKFFSDLKRHSRPKWHKAIKEFYKEVTKGL
jgi:hypothetical protein